ncbi:type VI secretion system Vgr family protein [Novipirellula artificiosorum]|uniref:Phage-related baseplate assembly protein n=1 Tax=Novipirellula artificiosorum TaxID=2528016 RepID=A0A5C6DBV1_9BACT|nr:type VI secretion system tip protein VgrG [Novipirellula artificiosorum]TWU34188.1 Phage-related baseplate assembly protein [Novipirellula artificiosorum]
MALSQKPRFLNLSTPLGDDVLFLTSFSGNEEMSRLFTYQLQMISDDNSIAAKDIVGSNVTFSVELADGSRRHFNGFVNRFIAGDEDREHRRNYRAEVVPWLWFLTRTADCRIFQNKTVPEIIEQILGDLGFSDFELQISLQHKSWDYCVQFRETDFNFISRLMEQEGIFYFFKHADGKHTLVMTDHKGAYIDCPENQVDLPGDFSAIAVKDHLHSWEHHYEFRPGKWAQTDFDFKKPSTSLMTHTDTIVDLPGVDKYEVYDYPGEYVERSDGEMETRLRMEEEEAHHDVVYGTSGCKTFTIGGRFRVGKHHNEDEEGKSYVITEIRHVGTESLGYETGSNSAETDYSNSFACIPDAVVFRPERRTAKPMISGVQTAIVVGPSGEEIYTDEYGRVKVQFHWDREGKNDENSSCWIRVAQNWAGENWGVLFNPRIGQEVVVDFIQGDPDRPIITGRVYNAEQMPPYDLPSEQTKSTIKTRSSKEGSPDNFNEIRFEDKKGEEELYIHAEKDRNTIVENNDTLNVGVDQTIEIGNNQSLKVGGQNAQEGTQTIEVLKDQMTTISRGDRSTKVEMGNDFLELKMGDCKVLMDLGKSETEAMQSIELKVGSSSVKVDQMGVEIKGMMVSIEGDLITDIKGLVTKVQGEAVLQAKGGVTMIN